MSNWQKRLIRVLISVAGIMMSFNAIPADTIEWIQTAGGWLAIIVTALYSNSDPLNPVKVKL